jgi:hypothetical protein
VKAPFRGTVVTVTCAEHEDMQGTIVVTHTLHNVHNVPQMMNVLGKCGIDTHEVLFSHKE